MIFHDLSILFDIFLHHFAPCHGRKTTMAAVPGSCGSSSESLRARCIASTSASPSSIASWTDPRHGTARHGVSHGVSHRVWKNGVLICFNGVLWWLLMVYDVWYMNMMMMMMRNMPSGIHHWFIHWQLNCIELWFGREWTFRDLSAFLAETCNEHQWTVESSKVQ